MPRIRLIEACSAEGVRAQQPARHRPRVPEPGGPDPVSVTDNKGRITYGNAAFVGVSGYSADKLLGQPHNLVRHPYMPEEAFRDL
jgi:PAS domain-containing protein